MPKYSFVAKTLSLSEAESGVALDRVLRSTHPGASWQDVRRLVQTGKVQVDGALVTDPSTRLDAGATVDIRPAAPRVRAEHRTAIVFADSQLVVVSKPAGISTVPFDDSERNTLIDLTRSLLERREQRRSAPLGVVQRLDKETSGLVVFARTVPAKRAIKDQFRAHTVHRRYDALVHGKASATSYRSRLVIDRGDGVRGSTDNSTLGREAITHVRVLAELAGATHVECRLETGRTHQIRIHLSEAGHPLVGERVYVRGYAGTLIAAPRLMLHARELGFEHPSTGRDLDFSEPLPEDMRAMIERLTSTARSSPGSRSDTSRRRSGPR